MSFWVTETVDSELLKAAHWAGGAASAAIDATRSLQQPEFSVSSKDDKQLQQLKLEMLEWAFHYMSGYHATTIMLSVILNYHMLFLNVISV